MIRLLIPALLMLLMSCQILDAPAKEPDSGLQGFSPDAEQTQRTACEGRGGSFTKAGISGGLICIETTGDGGKHCTNGSQCEGLCLARSNSCSPIKPLFGCHDIITDNGGKATICID